MQANLQLCHLYLTAVSDEERKRISQSFEALARNDVNVWKQVGFGVQRVLYDEIQALPENEKAELRPVIISLCELFLNPELQGTTWHFESVSLHRGAVVASEGYAEFRRKVMSMLCDLYRTAESVTDKLVAGGALSTAMRLPMDEARTEFSHAASLASNGRERRLLLERMAACDPASRRIN